MLETEAKWAKNPDRTKNFKNFAAALAAATNEQAKRLAEKRKGVRNERNT